MAVRGTVGIKGSSNDMGHVALHGMLGKTFDEGPGQPLHFGLTQPPFSDTAADVLSESQLGLLTYPIENFGNVLELLKITTSRTRHFPALSWIWM